VAGSTCADGLNIAEKPPLALPSGCAPRESSGIFGTLTLGPICHDRTRRDNRPLAFARGRGKNPAEPRGFPAPVVMTLVHAGRAWRCPLCATRQTLA
jgi:hypothetical protein